MAAVRIRLSFMASKHNIVTELPISPIRLLSADFRKERTRTKLVFWFLRILYWIGRAPDMTDVERMMN